MPQSAVYIPAICIFFAFNPIGFENPTRNHTQKQTAVGADCKIMTPK